MEFVQQPEDAKKRWTIKWLKWNIMKYPTIAIMCLPVPLIVYKGIMMEVNQARQLASGTYVPNVIMNKYAICRSDDWMALNTPKRYRN